MVACAHVDRPVAMRGPYLSGAELCRWTIHLYAVLGHLRAETTLAVMETSRSRRRDVPSASPAHYLLRDIRASVRYICPLVFRSVANQEAPDRMA